MTKYVMNMKNEGNQKLLPEGWRQFEICDCIFYTSKQGNETFKFTFSDCETYTQLPVYAVAEEGKRWFLKSILQACALSTPNAIYEWEEEDVIGKIIEGRIENVKEKWTNRFGIEKETTKSNVAEVRALSIPQEANNETIPF